MGAFHSVDPLVLDFVAWSTYHYVFDNPNIFVDPTGKAAVYIDGIKASSYELNLYSADEIEKSESTYKATTDPPYHVYVEVSFRATQRIVGFTGSIVLGIVGSVNSNGDIEWGLYSTGGLGIGGSWSWLPGPGYILNAGVGTGYGDLDDFGAWGVSSGGYSKKRSFEISGPVWSDSSDGSEFTLSGNPFPGLQKTKGIALYTELNYTTYLARSGNANDIIDYINNQLYTSGSYSEEVRTLFLNQLSSMETRLRSLIGPRP